MISLNHKCRNVSLGGPGLLIGMSVLAVASIVSMKASGEAKATGTEGRNMLERMCWAGECVYQSVHKGYQVAVILSPESGKHVASAIFDNESVAGIEGFARANRERAQEVFVRHSEVKTMVTFARPLSFDEFRDLMSQQGITVHEFAIRSIENGMRATTFGRPDGNDIAPQARYEMMAGAGDEFKGFIWAEATLTSAGYNHLAASPDVYLLDITEALVRDELAGRFTGLEVIRHSPYWNMEDLGLTREKSGK